MGRSSREKKEKKLEEGNLGEGIVSFPSTSLEKFYLFFIEIGVYFALFSPFITDKSYFFPFVSPKTIFFRVVVDLIFIVYILLVVSNRRFLPKLNALTLSIGLFLVISFLTSLTGVNFEKSFWGVLERMTGLLTLVHLFVFFLILTACFQERKHWERILMVSVIIGAVVGFNALATRHETSQTGGTVGNISFLAAYLLFNVFFAIILFFVKKGWWRVFYASSLIPMFLPLFATPEFPRGFFGAFFLGLFLLLMGYFVFSGKRLLKRLAPIIFISVILIGLILAQTSFFKRTFMDIREFPGTARKIVWQMGFDSWRERPWIGWGLENFNIPFANHFSPLLPANGDVWYDRVHNIILDTLVNSGIIGLLSYLAIFGVAIWKLLKTIPRIVEGKNLLFPLGMMVLLIVYFIQNFFVFDMISSYLVFFLSLAFISFLTVPPKPEAISVRLSPFGRPITFIGSLLIIISLFTIYFGNIQPARASKLIIKGLTSPLNESIPAFQSALAISPIGQYEGAEQFSRIVGPLAYDKNQDRALVNRAFELSIKELEKSLEDFQGDFRTYLLLGRHYIDFYNHTQDPEKLELAVNILLKSTELSPKNQQVYWSLAQAYLSQDKKDETYSAMQKSIDVEPRYGQSHWYLAMTYKAFGEDDLAAQKIKDAENAFYPYNWKMNLEDITRAIEVYQNLEDEERLLEVFPLAIEKDPNDARFWSGLGVTQFNLKMYKEARQSIQKAISLKPDFVADLEEFLKSLPPTP